MRDAVFRELGRGSTALAAVQPRCAPYPPCREVQQQADYATRSWYRDILWRKQLVACPPRMHAV
eukprot:2486102-Prorocentrum_lima.AAC.1